MIYLIPNRWICGSLRTAVDILLLLVINITVASCWAGLELACYGFTRPSTEDTVIGFVLCGSLFLNICSHYYYQRFRVLIYSWVIQKYQEGLGRLQARMMRTEKQIGNLKAIASKMGTCLIMHKKNQRYTEIYILLSRAIDGETCIIPSEEVMPLVRYLESIKAVWRYSDSFGIQIFFPAGGYPEKGE